MLMGLYWLTIQVGLRIFLRMGALAAVTLFVGHQRPPRHYHSIGLSLLRAHVQPGEPLHAGNAGARRRAYLL